MELDLASLDWRLRGWRPNSWRLMRSMELGLQLKTDTPEVPATVPGSVQGALRRAGILPDWSDGTASRDCEWVEHRQWEFVARLPPLPAGGRIELRADGLDHSGWILVDGREVAAFTGSLLRHRIDLGAWLGDGAAHELALVFAEPPDEQGQIGWTSQSRHFKPRYSYSWDWSPRLVPIGVWDRLAIVAAPPAAEVVAATAELDPDLRGGSLRLRLAVERAGRCTVVLRDPAGAEAARTVADLGPGEHALALHAAAVQPWWPNGAGAQPLYALETAWDGTAIDARSVGFKRVRYEANPGAAPGALPWVCVVNGRPLFLQGTNWTPAALDFHAVGAADYAELVALYRGMGCNLLRVWGGAHLEREAFYEACDRAGLLVWQEFPLSSSGIDNWAPEDPEAIARLCGIARDYIRRRCHHASRLLWCGGNELQSAAGRKDGCGVPLTLAHPCLEALDAVVREEDPGIRFLPCSPYGPCFMADPTRFGEHHAQHVHGPWSMGPGGLEAWRAYWAADDSTFRSEVGLPGAQSEALMRRHGGGAAWPADATSAWWLHASSWWFEPELVAQVAHLPADEALAAFIRLSQDRQAEGLAIAAAACKARFPACGGFIVWMGHDCFPCPANTAVIGFDRRPKPAYAALQRVFTGG